MLYSEAEKVLCFHGPLIYTAKILKAEKWNGEDNVLRQIGPHYLVHYDGWKKTWDEWVPESRLRKYNEENLSKKSGLEEAAKAGSVSSSSSLLDSKTKESTPMIKKKESDERKSSISSVRGTKRSRDTVEQEEEYLKRPEVKITIPDTLKVQLVDDWENITKKSELVPLPRKPCVKEILEEYKTYYLTHKKDGKKSPQVVEEVLKGLKLYFDRSLGQNLLYRFERAQFVEFRKKNGPKMGDGDIGNVSSRSSTTGTMGADLEPSDVYGAEHLLRLFVNLPMIIVHTSMDTESIGLLKEHLAEFLSYMVKEKHRLFVREYETASPSYQRLSSV